MGRSPRPWLGVTFGAEGARSIRADATRLPRTTRVLLCDGQVKGNLDDAGDFVSKQLPEASARVGKGAAEALQGAAEDESIGNPIREALGSLQKVGAPVFARGRGAEAEAGGERGSVDEGRSPADTALVWACIGLVMDGTSGSRCSHSSAWCGAQRLVLG